MDFIYLTTDYEFTSKIREACTKNSQYSEKCCGLNLKRFKHGTLLTISSNRKELDDIDKSESFVDGYFILDEVFHSEYCDQSSANINELLSKYESVNGCFSFVKINDDEVDVRADILSQYQLFVAKVNGSIVAFSNNIHMLFAALEECGYIQTINKLHAAAQCTYLSALSFVRISSNVECLPFGQRLTLSENGRIEPSEIASRRTVLGLDNYSRYSEELNTVANKLLKDTKAISKFAQDKNIVIDLSGGVDSRLTLACFIGAGEEKNMRFFNANNSLKDKAADQIVAENLANMFGLSGGIAITEADTGTATRNSFYRINGGNKVLLGTYQYYGLLPYAFEDFGELSIKNYGRVTGYCGEHTRAPGPNLGKLMGEERDAFANQASTAYLDSWFAINKNNASQYIDHSIKSELKTSVSKYIDDVLEEIEETKLLNTVFYLENRSRFHFGVRRQIGNKFRIVLSPLGSPLLLKLHKYLTYGQIFSNKIALDLMCKFAGRELALAPYADYRWAKNVVESVSGTYIEEHIIVKNTKYEGPSLIFPLPKILTQLKDNGPVKTPYSDFLNGDKDSLCTFIDYVLAYFGKEQDFFNLEKIRNFDENSASSQDKMNMRRVLSAMVFYGGIGVLNKLEEKIDVDF